MLKYIPAQEKYEFIDLRFGRLRYTVAAEHYGKRITWKSVIVNGIDGKEAGETKTLRWYNFLKRRTAVEAIIEKEGKQLLVDEHGRYRISFD